MLEAEVKFLGQNRARLERRLERLDATFLSTERITQVAYFAAREPNCRFRLRSREGAKAVVELTYKEKLRHPIVKLADEYDLHCAGSYDDALRLLKKWGLPRMRNGHNLSKVRDSYLLPIEVKGCPIDVRFEIDVLEYPKGSAPFYELEVKGRPVEVCVQALRKAARTLNLDWDKRSRISTLDVQKLYCKEL